MLEIFDWRRSWNRQVPRMRGTLFAQRAVVAGVLMWIAASLTMVVTAGAAASALPAARTPTADQIVNQFQKNEGVFRGFRRNHAKGVCISGYFLGSGEAARYSVAQVFKAGERTPFIGRFSIPGTSPYAWDDSTPIRGMALKLTQADGQEWRTAMNAVPAFPVATPAADYAFMKLQQPDPATGDPNPAGLARFFATHPHANAFRIWDQTTKPSASFATEQYNSLDTFELVDAQGRKHAVRWSMVPETKADGERAPKDQANFLAADLRQRLAHGPLKWHLLITFAKPGDRVNQADIAWPADRRHVDAGTLVVDATQPQKNGPCRDVNFDPLVLPKGIAPSADPLLKFRAEVYAVSHHRRVDEHQRKHAATHAPAAGTR